MNLPLTQLQPELVVRDAVMEDIDSIYSMMKSYSDRGILLPRSKSDICDNLLKFTVIDYNNETIACGALEIFTSELCEVRSLVVANHMKHTGLGRILVESLMEKARSLGLKRIMALTYVPDFFHKLGFKTVRKELFPEKVWSVCIKCYKFNDCDEIAVAADLQ